jgi:hypothetical protein
MARSTMDRTRLAEDLVFFSFSCLTGAFLCMMFGMCFASSRSD